MKNKIIESNPQHRLWTIKLPAKLVIAKWRTLLIYISEGYKNSKDNMINPI